MVIKSIRGLADDLDYAALEQRVKANDWELADYAKTVTRLHRRIKELEQGIGEDNKYLVGRLERIKELIDAGEYRMACTKILADISVLRGEGER